METREKILIVDDLEMNRHMLRIAFQNQYDLLEAENGKQALEMLKDVSVNLVVTDIFMDVMDGYELIQRIRQNPKYRNLPIIAVTESDKASRTRALEAGANDLLYRPYISEILHRRVNALLMNEIDLQKYKVAFENNPIPYLLYHVIDRPDTPSYKLVYMNNQASQKYSAILNMENQIVNTDSKAMQFLLEVLKTGKTKRITTYEEKIGRDLDITGYLDGYGLVAVMVNDITSQLEEYRDAQEMSEALINNTPGGFIRYKVQNNIPTVDYLSQGLADLLGYERSELTEILSADINALSNPEEILELTKAQKKNFDKGLPYDGEFRLRHKDGHYVWMRGITQVIHEKAYDYHYASYFDISTQKNADSAARENQQALKSAMEKNDLEYWMVDMIGQVIEDEKKPLRIEYVFKDDKALFESSMKKIYQGTENVSWECRMRTEDSAVFEWKKMNSFYLYDAEKKPYKAVVMSRNIQDRKTLEQFYVNSEEETDIWTWELDIDRRSLTAIGSTKNISKWPIGQALENIPQSLVDTGMYHEKSVNAVCEMYHKILDENASYAGTEVYRWSEPHQCYRWFFACVKVIDDGTLSGHRKAIAISKDITTEKFLEQQYALELENRKEISKSILMSGRINLSKGKVEDIWFENQNQLSGKQNQEIDFGNMVMDYLADVQLSEEEYREISVEGLLDSYERGITQVEKRYIATLKKTGERIWIDQRIKMMTAGIDGDIMAFYSAKDVTDSVISSIMSITLSEKTYDYMGYISMATGHFYLQKYGMEQEIYYEDLGPYGLVTEKSIVARVPEKEQQEARDNFNLSHIMEELKEKEEFEEQFHYVGKNGKVLCKQTKLRYSDATKEFIIVGRCDNTELLREAEEKQKQLAIALDEAKKANNAKTDFLSNMSHEIRTPMNAIIGMTKLAEDEMSDENSILQGYLREIDSSSEYMLGILNDILDMSRIESGKSEMNIQWTAPNEILLSCIEMVMPMMQKKNITFDYPKCLYKSAEYEFQVDVQKTKQMVMNLLNNAYKFTGEGGHISIYVKNLSVDLEHCIATDQTIIKDDGCGMSKEFLERIFTPFEQEKNCYSGSVRGTGLGLALAKNIAKQMGGDIAVESELGKGSVFTITYTYHFRKKEIQSADNKELIENNPESGLEGMHILLAEDHPLNATIATKILEKKGIIVTRVDNGKEALEKIQNEESGTFDAILMDVRMPVMDGLEATRKIRSLERADTAKIPIIAMTANAYEEDRRQSLEAGMNEHLAKPVQPEILFATLAKYTKR